MTHIFHAFDMLHSNCSEPRRLQIASHFVAVAYPPYAFSCKTARSCKHDAHFYMKMRVALNGYILKEKEAPADAVTSLKKRIIYHFSALCMYVP